MLNSDQRKQMISRIKELPAALEEAVRGLDDQQLNTPYRQGGWTPSQVVHHLADSHMNAFIRVKLILTENQPTLKTYKQNLWAMLPDAASVSIQTSMIILVGLHRRFAALFESLGDSDWQKSAIHPESGEINIDDLHALYSSHGDNHIAQIKKLRDD